MFIFTQKFSINLAKGLTYFTFQDVCAVVNIPTGQEGGEEGRAI